MSEGISAPDDMLIGIGDDCSVFRIDDMFIDLSITEYYKSESVLKSEAPLKSDILRKEFFEIVNIAESKLQ